VRLQPAADVLRNWLDLARGDLDFELYHDRLRAAPRLAYLTVDTTGACDLSCPGMCYYHPSIDLRLSRVSEKSLQVAIAEACANLGLQNLVFAGKEPLLDVHRMLSLLKFAAAIPGRDFSIGIVTNGRHILRLWKYLTDVVESGFLSFLDISIDSGVASQHDGIRGVVGTFDLATSALERCIREWTTVRVSVSSVLRHDNAEGILELYKGVAAECRNFFVTPIQPPPFTSTTPLTWNQISSFLHSLCHLLRSGLAGKGIEIMVSLLGLYLYDAEREGFFSWRDFREDSQGQCFTVKEIAGNRLIFHGMVLPETGWRIARITSTGAYLSNSHFLQDPDPDRHAVGFIQDEPIQTLYRRATDKGSILNHILASRHGHACASRPCWSNCFGGLTVAENHTLDGSPPTTQPRLCLKDDKQIICG
jgi:hypothetical protein